MISERFQLKASCFRRDLIELKFLQQKEVIDDFWERYSHALSTFTSQVYTSVWIMPSKMEVASQHCDTVPNQTKDILDNVKIERIFIF